ncbi:MAG TPA: hypothetical protein VK501_19720 [Baekduia sp.]|uniref:hypothetical protein n=1 Tax=Baekduia sp. TaxID=2600305 RepID=UPI002CDB0FB2|nr:hypothetical protein [Baekduia sp.]HMJ36141.1 hypothetical protein [Baekduia sp.]
MTSSTAPITIRRATADDAAALERLARLDSQRLPAGPHLVALSGDRYVAAASLADGRWVADPFAVSAPIVELLRQRVASLTGRAPRRPGDAALDLLRGLLPSAPRGARA